MQSIQKEFKKISSDDKFLARVKQSIDNIMKDNKVDQFDVPEIIFLITDSVNEMNNLQISYDDLPVLLKMLYNFVVEKFNLIPVEKRADFDRLVDVAIKLVMLQPKVKKEVTKCMSWFSCFNSNAVVDVQTPSEPAKNEAVTEPAKTEPAKLEQVKEPEPVNPNTNKI